MSVIAYDFAMTAAPSNADTRIVAFKALANLSPMSANVYEPQTAGELTGLTELAGIGQKDSWTRRSELRYS